ALAGLGPFARPKDRPIVAAGTRDDEPGVRAAAARSLGAYRDDAAADTLSELLRGDGDERVRLAAIQALLRIDLPRAMVALVRAMDGDGHPRVRVAALHAVLAMVELELPDPPQPHQVDRWRKLTAKVKRIKFVREMLANAPPPGVQE
ncbi:hypothetical protein LCGC14_1285310, partial [marine sediment metagenome]